MAEAQMVKCKGCARVISVAASPDFLKSKDWKKEILWAAENGHTIETGEFDRLTFGCECPPKVPDPDPQMSLF
jgi:hypothetical protein